MLPASREAKSRSHRYDIMENTVYRGGRKEGEPLGGVLWPGGEFRRMHGPGVRGGRDGDRPADSVRRSGGAGDRRRRGGR